ncbi:MAG: hypothetical protein JNK05_02480 [Myxococcales bacterium]|nr:hypothetical protein [Myxococcales bacterium]
MASIPRPTIARRALVVLALLAACDSPVGAPRATADSGVRARPTEPSPADAETTTITRAPIATPTPSAERGRDAIAGLRCSVSRQGRLHESSEFAAEDVNHDGVLDLVERVSTEVAASAAAVSAPDAARVTLPWARIGRGERCVIDDRDARAYALSRCPTRPTRFVSGVGPSQDASRSAALMAVACARAWGVEPVAIRRSLEREPAARLRAAGVTLDALARFAESLGPPWVVLARPPAR